MFLALRRSPRTLELKWLNSPLDWLIFVASSSDASPTTKIIELKAPNAMHEKVAQFFGRKLAS